MSRLTRRPSNADLDRPTVPRRRRLHVISPVFPPATGGIETLSAHLVSAFDDHDITVSTLVEPNSTAFDAADVEVRRYRNQPRGGRKAVIGLWFWALRDLLRSRPDVVLCMHARCAPPAALYSLFRPRARYLQYFHAKEIAVWPKLSKLAVRTSDTSVAVSSYTAGLLAPMTRAKDRVVIIPPAVQGPFHAGPKPVHKRARVVAIGRMAESYKGFDTLIAAWSAVTERCPGVELVLIGDGILRPDLERVATETTGRILFLGQVDDRFRDAMLDDARVFALPSRTSADGRSGEGFGIVYAEAAARGVPVIASDQGGATDAVAHQLTGLLIDPTSVSAVSDALIRLLTDDALVERMSTAAVQWAKKFSVPALRASIRGLVDDEGTS